MFKLYNDNLYRFIYLKEPIGKYFINNFITEEKCISKYLLKYDDKKLSIYSIVEFTILNDTYQISVNYYSEKQYKDIYNKTKLDLLLKETKTWI